MHQQIIIVENRIKPQIRTCEDLSICVDKQSCEGLLNYTLEAFDDCLQSDELSYMYALSVNSKRVNVQSRTVSKYLPIGQHTIYWTVYDGCKNTAVCSHQITVQDCQAPSIICLGQVTSTLPDLGLTVEPVVEILANDLVKDSFTDCSSTDNTTLSFSKDSLIQNVQFGCADIGDNLVEVVVKGNNGTHSSCITTITIQDNENLCGQGRLVNGMVAGSIISETGVPISEVKIILRSNDDSYSAVSNSEGSYSFENIPLGEEYQLSLSKPSDAIAGISVRDIVMLQNHIIGKKYLKSAYQVIAGDLDLSGHLSVIDLVHLKAILLGKSTYFDSWTFINEDNEFIDPMSPWPIQYNNTMELNSEELYSFIGMKKGDLDHSFAQAETRSSMNINIPYSFSDLGIKLDLSDIDFELLHLVLSNSESVNILHNKEQISTDDLSSSYVDDLYTYSFLVAKSTLDKSTLVIKGLSNVDKLYATAVSPLLEEIPVKFELQARKNIVNIIPNPFNENLNISIKSIVSETVKIQLFDVNGRLIQDSQYRIEKGLQQVNLSVSDELQQAVYYLHISGPSFGVKAEKIIKS